MNGRRAALGVAALVLLTMVPTACERQTQQVELPTPAAEGKQDVAIAPAGDLRISGPFQHANLGVFLVHGKDSLGGGRFLTLEEALAKKVLVVHETGDVNELAVDNLSETESIFIQGGEIVSGGKQDRMLGLDLVVAPKAKGVKIASFCVEQGRWRQRGGEPVANFYCRSNVAFSRELKIAAKRDKSQSGVWGYIRKAQSECLSNVAGMRLSPESPSSLDLTLEDPELKASVKAYRDTLAKIVDAKDDVIGFVYAVNGELYGADVYGCNALFRKLWPKLLKGSAVEAIAKLKKEQTFDPPPLHAVTAWVTTRREGKGNERPVTERLSDRLRAVQLETDADIVFDLFDRSASASVHTSYIRKPAQKPQPEKPAPPQPRR